MVTLAWIIVATLAGGVVSVLAAAALSLTILQRYSRHLVSFAVGAMLAAAMLNLLPEASEAGLSMGQIGGTVLVGLFTFFILEKIALWRHSHHHEEADPGQAAVSHNHGHHHGHHHHAEGSKKAAAWLILVGDSVHNFADGVLLAAAFLQDVQTGIAATIAVAAHEIPQELGDFMILLNGGFSRKKALAFNILSSLTGVLGGVIGYFVLSDLRPFLPYVLVFCAASFIYIAVADLVPELHRSVRPQLAPLQLVLMVLGAFTVAGLGGAFGASFGGHAH